MVNKKSVAYSVNQSQIILISNKSEILKEKIGKENVFDFSIGSPSVYPPKELNEEIMNVINNVDPIELHKYTQDLGLKDTRTAIVDYLNKKYNLDESPDYIYLTHGASSALSITINALASKNDEFIVFAPYFADYNVYIENANSKVVVVSPDKNFLPDFHDFKKKINKHTKAVIINSPNNPTGVIYDESVISEISNILRKAEAKYKHPIYLISDEPYRELIFKDMEYPFVTKYYDNSIVIYSFSKVISIPGERFGYILLSNRMADKDEVFNAIKGSGRALGYLCASTMFQKMIPSLLGKTADLDQYRKNKKLFEDMFDELGYEYVKSDGAFYLFIKSLDEDSVRFSEVAQKFNIFIVPSEDFGVKGYERVSYCASEESIKKSYNAFKSLKEYYEAQKWKT